MGVNVNVNVSVMVCRRFQQPEMLHNVSLNESVFSHSFYLCVPQFGKIGNCISGLDV